MPKLVINLSSHPQQITVSQMRKRLAQVLSKLNGDQEVSFNFIATLENYQPAVAPKDIYEPFAASRGILRSTAKSRILGMGYTFGQDGVAPQKNYCLHPNGFEDGICHSCMLLETDFTPTAVFGELARPAND